MNNDDEHTSKRIAALNDAFRFTFFTPSPGPRPVPGLIVSTRGIAGLPEETRIRIWLAVAGHDEFPEGDDPYGEHDFGALDIEGVNEKIFWKIDYYADSDCVCGSEDPADPKKSFRVLTIMLASEY